MCNREKSKKVVLFHPHYQAGDYSTSQRQPLDLLSISGMPDQRRYRVVLIDASVNEDHRRRVLEACRDALCFGTTSIIGHLAFHSHAMAKEVKSTYPSLPVVAGGWFPSVAPEMMLGQGGADIVVMRRGELTFVDANWGVSQKRVFEFCEGLLAPGDSVALGRLVRGPCHERGFIPQVSYIAGYPGESEESVQATIEEACEIVHRWPKVELAIRYYLPIPGTPLHRAASETGYRPVTALEEWAGYQNLQTQLYSSVNSRQVKIIRRCQRHYFWWGSERLKLNRRLDPLERLLHATSRFRLRHKLFAFPIEYKLYGRLGRLQ